jgi:K+-transporting ATPase ATPase C chain
LIAKPPERIHAKIFWAILAAQVPALPAADPESAASVSVDVVAASASGLGPQISPAAAGWQIARVARARSETEIAGMVARVAQQRWLGALGQARVNVLQVNLRLDDKW